MELNISYGDATDDFKDQCVGKRPEPVKIIVAHQPPVEPPDLRLSTNVQCGETQRKSMIQKEQPPTSILYFDTEGNKEMEARAAATLSSGASKKGTPGAS
ncbi:hypothetical protein PIB30_019639 [Stylosanthes scabra]|uniref:Uncharacterized protein n=1 Tax=Stylosanthes scabra TaxID=79078 RepID=A0ABU6S844_9FABA|nr:hypothetical protein [Stylosanthes scabra]